MMRLNTSCTLMLLLTGLLGTAGMIQAQFDWEDSPVERDTPFQNRDRSSHQFFVFSGTNPDTNNILVFIKIPNTGMQFVKEDNGFTARYEISVLIQKEPDVLIASQVRRGNLTADSFQNTRSPALSKYELFQFQAVPGKYKVLMEIYDLETKKPQLVKDVMTVPDFSSQALACSDILFLDTLVSENPDIMQPLMPPVRDAQDTSFYARIDLYSNPPKTVQIEQTILNNQGKLVYQNALDITMTNSRHPIFFKLGHNFPFGQYTLNIKITGDGFDKTVTGKFYIKWQGHPASMPDMETAIASLVYVMDKDSWKEIQSAPDSGRTELLESFWKSRDPNPETVENELEEEYYRRVTYANREFSIYKGSQEGWRTDRGRIYIIYGPPSDIDRPPLRPDNTGRYEIWIYQTLPKRFVFFDKYGDGDYRLISQE